MSNATVLFQIVAQYVENSDTVTHDVSAGVLTLTRPLFINSGSVSTTYTAIDYASISAPQVITIENRHASASLLVSLDSGVSTDLTIPPGIAQPLFTPGNNVQVKSSTGTVLYTYSIGK